MNTINYILAQTPSRLSVNQLSRKSLTLSKPSKRMLKNSILALVMAYAVILVSSYLQQNMLYYQMHHSSFLKCLLLTSFSHKQLQSKPRISKMYMIENWEIYAVPVIRAQSINQINAEIEEQYLYSLYNDQRARLQG